MQKKTISDNKVQQEFATVIRGEMALVISKRTGQVILQSRLIMTCDPLLTMQYIQELARSVYTYELTALRNR